MIKNLVHALLLLLITTACVDEPDCYNLNNYVIGVDFKKLEDSTTDTMFVNAMGTVEPGLLFLVDTSFTRLNLPLNYFVDETTFFFEDPDSLRLLRLGYVSQAQFVSENCGEKFVLTGLRVLEHNFDSVRLVRDVPTAEAGTIHIEIFQ